MSRQLKFRAWVKSDKRMITDKQDFIPLIVTNKGVMKLQPQFEASYYEILPNEWFELMQYTGLKYKNGVEIYEGDIVQWSVDADQVGEEPLSDTYTVIYRNGGFYLENHKDIYPKYEPISEVVRFCGEYQVLGNIYEHAELIKESK